MKRQHDKKRKGIRMTNEQLLRQTIAERGLKITFVAASANLTYQGFLNKLTNKREFTAGEMQRIGKVLKLNRSTFDKIFFA